MAVSLDGPGQYRANSSAYHYAGDDVLEVDDVAVEQRHYDRQEHPQRRGGVSGPGGSRGAQTSQTEYEEDDGDQIEAAYYDVDVSVQSFRYLP